MGDEPYKLQREVKKDKKELDDVFYGDSNLMASLPKFYENLKKQDDDDNIDYNETEFYYDNQAVKQVFQPYERQKVYKHIVAMYPFERVYIDTMYLRLGNSTLAFVNIVDAFSKYAYSKMFVLPLRSQAITSAKALSVFEEFLEVIKKYDFTVGIVYLDRGSEFVGDFLKYLDSKVIPHVYGNAGDKRKTSLIERFNKTLRWYLQKFRAVKGRIDNNVLKTILSAYNNVSHANLKHTPIEILESKEYQNEVEEHFIDVQQENELNVLPIGTSVRILLDQSPFKKTAPVWSSQVYTISDFHNSNYELDDVDGYYKFDELQPINEDFVMNTKVKTDE